MAGTGRIRPQYWVRSARRAPVQQHRAALNRMPTAAAGSWQAGGNALRKWLQPAAVPMESFTQQVRVPIGNNGIRTSIIESGAAVISLGPQGIGTRWYPKTCTIATQAGPVDPGTATGYFETVQGQPVFQSYACGGDTQPLAVPDMQPGDLLYVVFSGSSVANGGWCSVQVIGDMDALTF
jgi:hypothetical protein